MYTVSILCVALTCVFQQCVLHTQLRNRKKSNELFEIKGKTKIIDIASENKKYHIYVMR